MHATKELSFKNRTVVITGGTRGIGKAIAEAFLDLDAQLIITGTRPKAPDYILENKSTNCPITYLQADFSSQKSLKQFLQDLAALPQIDVCINNAGINRIASIDVCTETDYDAVTAVNMRAPYLICSAVSKNMKKNGYGRIINIASIWSIISKSGRSSYSASKCGLVGMTRSIAIDLAPHGILVNAISPGFVNTELTASTLSQSERCDLAKQVPLRRFGQPEEIAELTMFLASESNTYITGQNIIIDGGFTNV